MAKYVDLEKHVDEKLRAHQRDDETLSETLQRLVDLYEERRAD